MRLTDPASLKILKKLRSYELEQRIEDYPEDERDGRSDMEMLKNELSWYVENLDDNGCTSHEALLEAKRILARTKYGKEIPLNRYTLKPMWKPREIQEAKEFVNEYNRLKRMLRKL